MSSDCPVHGTRTAATHVLNLCNTKKSLFPEKSQFFSEAPKGNYAGFIDFIRLTQRRIISFSDIKDGFWNELSNYLRKNANHQLPISRFLQTLSRIWSANHSEAKLACPRKFRRKNFRKKDFGLFSRNMASLTKF